MRKILLAAIVVGSFLLVGSGAARATLVQVDVWDTYDPADILMNNNVFDYGVQGVNVISYSHNIIDDGYIPASHTLTFAEMAIFVRDDATDPAEGFKITIDATVVNANQVIGTNTSFEYNVWSSLTTDGILNVTINRVNGDFWFEKSLLNAKWEYDNGIVIIDDDEEIPPIGAAVVPEPATMLLLGTGLVGVAGAVRRKKKLV